MRSTCLVLFALAALAAGSAAAPAGRPAVTLDGTWEFRFTPDDRGDAERWYVPEARFGGRIRVPGCWDAQGVGRPTEKLRTNGVGVGWYRRRVSLPADWQGRHVWLVVGGAHRAVRAWCNGRYLGEHVGYPTEFRVDATPALQGARDALLVLAVDSRPHLERDPLAGAFDLLDYMDVHWGGLFEQVRLEATGDAWLDDVFVQPDPPHQRAVADVSIAGAQTAGLALRYSVRARRDGRLLASGEKRAAPGETRVALSLTLPGAPLWTPETPNLLTLDLTLLNGQQVLDRRSVRFGQRRLEVRGADFILNGERFLLRGYGDDYTFPLDITPRPDVGTWRRYLLRRKEFGFNGVRHHSTMPSESYLAAADEAGVFVQPELPIAYEPFFQRSTDAGKDLYRAVWRDYIRQMRNHPSVFAWCMGNEEWNGFALGPELYETARRLDPTRPVVDTDGVWSGADRPTLDYLSVQHSEGTIPWGRSKSKYQPGRPATRPVIVHEMSNLSVLPDPADIPRYTGVIKPTWIEAMAKAVKAQGLQARLPLMLQASRGLQASLLKLNIEAARLNADVDGHHQWLFRDYWHQSTGFVNQFDQARALTPAMARRFVAPAVLLWERDRASYRAGESVSLRIFLSDYRPAAAPALGPVHARLGRASLTLSRPEGAPRRGVTGPFTGTLRVPDTAVPVRERLVVEAGNVRNEWPLWVFPAAPAPGAGITCVRSLNRPALDRLEKGASVFVACETAVFPAQQASFKTAWWHGDEGGDHVFGNLLLPHPALRGFPCDAWGDLQMAGMMDGRPVAMLDEVPGHIEPIVWCLDVPWRMRRKAYLFEARVGAGRLLVSTLDLSPANRKRDPAAEWLYGRLAAYAGSDEFRPAAEIPAPWLRDRLSAAALPDPATWVEGFGRLAETTETGPPWYSYRDDEAATYPVRQTDGRQRLRWQTAPVPAGWSHSTVTFVWAGGLGWVTEPGGGHFSVALNGAPLLDFPFADKSATWKSADGLCSLTYEVRRRIGPDTLGLFYLTLPAGRVAPGTAAELAVTATAQQSKRWFALQPYTDVVAGEREP